MERDQIDLTVPFVAVGTQVAPFAGAETALQRDLEHLPQRRVGRCAIVLSRRRQVRHGLPGRRFPAGQAMDARRRRIAIEDTSRLRVENEQGKAGVGVQCLFRRFALQKASVFRG